MKQSKIRKLILDITEGNLRYCDPKDPICMDRVKNPFHKGCEGFTTQSAEEVLDDIIVDLKLLQDELSITASLNSAQL
tara:strand:+ start:2854 stop:3087 length:234 start_codon:yes stop_codon:yes gene_type:complete